MVRHSGGGDIGIVNERLAWIIVLDFASKTQNEITAIHKYLLREKVKLSNFKLQAPFICLNCKANIIALPLSRKLIHQSKINCTLTAFTENTSHLIQNLFGMGM